MQRCKFRVFSNDRGNIVMLPVGSSAENQCFFASVASGSINLNGVEPAVAEQYPVGRECAVDIVPDQE